MLLQTDVRFVSVKQFAHTIMFTGSAEGTITVVGTDFIDVNS